MSDDFRGRGGSPWGSPPGGGNNNGSGRGPTPPNIDAVSEQNMHGEHAFNTYKTRHVPQYAECLLRELGGREAKI